MRCSKVIKKYAESSLRAAKGNATFLWNALRLQMQPKEQRKRLSGMILISIILNRERTLPIFFRLDLCLASRSNWSYSLYFVTFGDSIRLRKDSSPFCRTFKDMWLTRSNANCNYTTNSDFTSTLPTNNSNAERKKEKKRRAKKQKEK